MICANEAGWRGGITSQSETDRRRRRGGGDQSRQSGDKGGEEETNFSSFTFAVCLCPRYHSLLSCGGIKRKNAAATYGGVTNISVILQSFNLMRAGLYNVPPGLHFFGVFLKRAGFRASVPSSSSFLLPAATSWSLHQQQLWWTDALREWLNGRFTSS